MSEIIIDFNNMVDSQKPEESSKLQEDEKGIIKFEYSNSSALSADEKTKQAESKGSENVEAKAVKNEPQAELTKVEGHDCFELEQLSLSSSSPEGSELTNISLESYKEEMENFIICVGNEYAYNQFQDPKNLYKRNLHNTKGRPYRDFARRQDDIESDRNFRSRRIADGGIKFNKRINPRDDYYIKYSPGKIRSTYYSKSYRRSRSWDRSRSRYISARPRRSRSWDKNRRYRDSRSPPYRSRRRRRHNRSRHRSHNRSRSRSRSHYPSRNRSRSRSRSHYPSRNRSRSRSRSHYPSRNRSRSRSRSHYPCRNRSRSRSRSHYPSRSCSRSRSHSRSHNRSRSHNSNYGSPKQSSYKRDLSIKKNVLSSDSSPGVVEELLDHLKWPDNWSINRQKAKSSSSEPSISCISQPPLPNSPPPPKPPPPEENYSGVSRSPVTINHAPTVGPPHLWINPESQFRHLYALRNLSMPSVSVNNLPLVPGLGNLPVHITPTGEQILHDMAGRPIPVGPNGRLLPVDMSGRLFPHVAFLYNDQAAPIYMTEDGVLRLPNGEPVPFGNPNQLPVNIDGNIIPIGPDSRPLYQCPNIPLLNAFTSSQVGSTVSPVVGPVEPPQKVRIDLLSSAVVLANQKRFNQVRLSPAVIQIQPVSDSEFKNKRVSCDITEIEVDTDSNNELEKNKCEEPAATETQSTADVEKPEATTKTESSVKLPKENEKVIKTKLYENVDLKILVEKFSNRVSSLEIRTLYQKKIEGNLKRMKPEAEVCVANKKSEPAHGCVAIPEKESLCTVQSDNCSEASVENSSNSRNDHGLSAEEAFCEKKFTETIHEAVSLFAEIDFNPPALGRFLFSNSPTYFVNQNPPNASPLLRNKIKLPFLSSENLDAPPKKKKSSSVSFRFLPEKDVKLLDKTTTSSFKPSFAVQCDFTSKKFQILYTKIDVMKKELLQYKNENEELKDLCNYLREEDRKKTEELNALKKTVEEKNKIIRNLTQPRRQYWA